MAKLGKDEIVTIRVLKEKGQSNVEIAQTLGVTEGAVRYRLGREGLLDGRKKGGLIEQLGLGEAVGHWWRSEQERLRERPPNVMALWAWLVEEHEFAGSYKSVRKYVAGHFERPKLRPFRRVETPPGAQTQSDWFEQTLDVGCGPETLYGFVMLLSHSRMPAVVWSRSMDQLAWHRVHNEAFRRLGGVAAVNRIDNLKTGVAHGAGPWGELNESYRTYARSLGFHVDPHEVRQPQQKGKCERLAGIAQRLDMGRRTHESLEQLQAATDQRLIADVARRLCPATGRTIAETWQAEQPLLRPLPACLPEPFNLVKTCQVHKDCTVRFEGRSYTVPFRYVGQQVEVRGCSGFLQVLDPRDGQIVQQHPRGGEATLVIDPRCYEGEATDTVAAPRPLGRMSRKLAELAAAPVPLRSIEIYARLAEVAR